MTLPDREPLTTIAWLAALAALIAGIHRTYHVDRRQLVPLIASRQSESICEFARSFDCRRTDTWVIRAVYEELQDYHVRYGKLPIRATDLFESDLLIDDEENRLPDRPSHRGKNRPLDGVHQRKSLRRQSAVRRRPRAVLQPAAATRNSTRLISRLRVRRAEFARTPANCQAPLHWASPRSANRSPRGSRKLRRSTADRASSAVSRALAPMRGTFSCVVRSLPDSSPRPSRRWPVSWRRRQLPARPSTTKRLVASAAPENAGQWLAYGRDSSEQRFSPLTQINADNARPARPRLVRGSQRARRQLRDDTRRRRWRRVRDSPWSKLYAFDGKTGEPLWKYDPKVPGEFAGEALLRHRESRRRPLEETRSSGERSTAASSPSTQRPARRSGKSRSPIRISCSRSPARAHRGWPHLHR